MKEPSETERALWNAIKALDIRVLAVDNVPRVSLDFDGDDHGRYFCICAKMWSKKYQETMYVESWCDTALLERGTGDALVFLGGPMGIVAMFEQEEALRSDQP